MMTTCASADFHQRDEVVVRLLVGWIIVALGSRVFDLAMVGHSVPPKLAPGVGGLSVIACGEQRDAAVASAILPGCHLVLSGSAQRGCKPRILRVRSAPLPLARAWPNPYS